MHMRYMLMILGTAVAAIAIGTGLYYFGPEELREVPASGSEASALGTSQGTDVPFTVLAEGTDAANVPARKNYAVYDADELARLWTMAYGASGPAVPSVDFDTHYVIAVFAGEKPTGGYSIKVEDVSDQAALRYVSILLTTPGAACTTTQAITSPFQIVTVPFSDRELARVEKQTEGPCR